MSNIKNLKTIELAARNIRSFYYDNVPKVASITEMRSLIRALEAQCNKYKINSDCIFWSNEKFDKSMPGDYLV